MSSGTSHAYSRGLDRGLLTLLFLSLATNAYFAVRLRHCAERSTAERYAVVDIGTAVPAVQVDDIDGKPVNLRFDGDRATVLYVVSPTCGWCKRNADSFRALSASRSGQYRFVGLSTQAQDINKKEHGLEDLPVYTHAPEGLVNILKLGPTPTTIVISAEGTVLKAWVGAYTGATRADVSRFFQVTLPALPNRETRTSQPLG
jgi:peroxiredoxin